MKVLENFWRNYEQIQQKNAEEMASIWRDYVDNFFSGRGLLFGLLGDKDIELLERTLDVIQNTISSVTNSAIRAGISTLGQAGVDHPPFTSKVVTAEKAFLWALEGVQTEFLLDQAPVPPNSVQLAERLSKTPLLRYAWKLWSGSTDLVKIISGKVAKYLKVTLPIRAAAILGQFIRVVVIIFVLELLVGMLQRRNKLLDMTLQQSTPRKRVKSSDGVIMRREPGGNKP
jgi:hypothetical protein